MPLPPGFVKVEGELPPGFVRERPVSGQGTSLDAFLEPARAIGSGLTRSIGGGWSGIAAAVIPGGRTGAEQVEAVTAGTFQPQTEAGQAGLKTLGDLAQKGIDIVNFPISGLGGLLELITGGGLEQAVDTIKSVQERGAGVTAGERVFEETGSPLLATEAQVAPEAFAEILGLKGAGAAIVPVSRAGKIVEAAFTRQSATKQRIARLIDEGSTDVETAKFRLEEPKASPAPETGTPRVEPDVLPDVSQPTSNLPEFLNVGGPRVRTDRIAVAAINQGFDEGVIAAIKGATDADRLKFLEMVNIMERGKKNARFAALNRPSDIAGDALLERFNVVLNANKIAGKELDGIAQSLKGRQVDPGPAIDQFLGDLDSMGITLKRDNTVNFRGSDIEGLTAPEAAIKRIVRRLSSPQTLDAFELHRMKKFIDEIVTFGKQGEGLAGKTERILKNLRRNLDGILDEGFPEYNRVNTTFSETIGAIDAFQDVAGRKMNLTGPNASRATGTLMRRLLSNAQSRVTLLDAVDEIEKIAARYGGAFDDDLLTQILFVDELDSVFGPVARTSFSGQIAQNIPRSKADLLDRAVQATVDTFRGVNQDAAFAAIKELLQ